MIPLSRLASNFFPCLGMSTSIAILKYCIGCYMQSRAVECIVFHVFVTEKPQLHIATDVHAVAPHHSSVLEIYSVLLFVFFFF